MTKRVPARGGKPARSAKHSSAGERPRVPTKPKPKHSHQHHRPKPKPPRDQRPGRPEPEGPPPNPDEIGLGEGVLELHPKGYGFLRDPSRSYSARPGDPYVSAQLIAKHRLREGILLTGPTRPPHKGDGPRLMSVETIEGLPAEEFAQRVFDDLTPIDPREQIRLETGPEPYTTRVIDMFAPIGKGQRALIVAPPRTGKTVLLQHMAHAVAVNHPEMHLMMLLIDERPEEVTEMRRTVQGEVIASSADQDTVNHVRTAELALERAKRLSEQGKQVFVLLDSLTRLARAYNKAAGNSGRTMSGGLDIRALEIPKRLFGSARAFDEGGSLTIVGTALIQTGSRMDDVIFEEFKGTGNMELILDRKLADRRIYPAIDLAASGTRKEERLLDKDDYERITLLRRSLMQMSPLEAMEGLVKQLSKFPSNAEFLKRMSKFVR